MSAIFGIIRFDGAEADAASVRRMGATMRHRAPDGSQVRGLGPVALGHGRMIVQREDRFDAQPRDDGDVTLVVEGRLDNRAALAATFGISDHDLRDMPDSALVISAYRYWGDAFPEHLLGDFACALWDARTRQLLLARDHMGQRHLLFHHGEGFLAFASEIKALWALGDVPRVMRRDATMRSLLVQRDAAAPDTLFEGILGLRGGERMLVGLDGGTERRRYWTPCAAPEHEGRDEAYYVATYRRILAEAVSCRLRRLEHAPALHMSGGFDSSAIAGLAGQIFAGQGRRMLAIASVMPEAERGRYPRDARPMVEYCQRDMPHLDVHWLTREGLDPFGGPGASAPPLDGPAAPLDHVYLAAARVARGRGLRQLMDGHGGDYTLNPRGRGAIARLLARGDLRGYRREVAALHRRFGTPVAALVGRHIREALDPWVRRWRSWSGAGASRTSSAEFLRPAAIDAAVAGGAVRRDEFGLDAGPATEGRGRIARTLGLVSGGVGWAGLDMVAWGEGLAVTRPFHDKRVVELALAIPEALYFRGGRDRYLACRALADIYPPEFQDRPFHNDQRVADMAAVVARAGPELAARARNLPDDLIDRDTLAEALGAERPWDARKATALNVLMVAEYQRWFSGANAT